MRHKSQYELIKILAIVVIHGNMNDENHNIADVQFIVSVSVIDAKGANSVLR